MNRKIAYFALIMLLGSFISGCSNDAEPTNAENSYVNIPLTEKMSFNVKSANDFAINMFKLTSEDFSEENVCISPYSLFVAMSMIANNEDAETSQYLLDILTNGESSLSQLNEYNQLLLQYLPKVDAKSTCSIANSLWHDPAYIPQASFVKTIEDYYEGALFAQNPGNEDGRLKINSWVNEKTHGMIPEFLKNPTGYNMALINAAYFKSTWVRPFDPNKTTSEDFENINKSISTARMMHDDGSYRYSCDEDFQLLEIGYGNRNYYMSILIPANDQNLNEMIQSIDNNVLMNLYDQTMPYDVTLSMPVFSMKFEFDALKVLNKFGIESLALSEASQMKLNSLQQSVALSVDEEGTKAAAATHAGWVTAGTINKVTVNLNKPFVYLIRETSTGTILFMGKQVKF